MDHEPDFVVLVVLVMTWVGFPGEGKALQP